MMYLIIFSAFLFSACHAQAQTPTTAQKTAADQQAAPSQAQPSNIPTASPSLAAPGAAIAPSAPAANAPFTYDPQVVSTLLDLLNVKDNTRPSNSDFTDTSLADILKLGTPTGYFLRNRYTHLSVSLADALVTPDDKRLHDQLVELARWERDPDMRSVALITLATRKEPASFNFFREALDSSQTEIRFAALEALEIWDQPQAKDLFVKVSRSDISPVIRIYAAQALYRHGDDQGLELLRKELDSSDWLARAMAAKYIGDLGTGDDYDRLLNRMTMEANNNFVLAECAIGALKLFPKKQQ